MAKKILCFISALLWRVAGTVKVIFCELHGLCYPLNIVEFLENTLKNTGLEVTGWFVSNQSQSDAEDNAVACTPMASIECGDYRCVVLERKC